MSNSQPSSLLRKTLTALLDSKLTDQDLKALAIALRRDLISAELAYLLERSIAGFTQSDDQKSSEYKEIKSVIKNKKITKSSVESVLKSIGFSIKSENGASRTLDSMLNEFFASATNRQQKQLIDILTATQKEDSYLRGITDRRAKEQN